MFIIQAIVASFLWGMIPIIIKYINISNPVTYLVSNITGNIFFYILLSKYIYKESLIPKTEYTSKDKFWLLLRGISRVLQFLLVTIAFQKGSIILTSILIELWIFFAFLSEMIIDRNFKNINKLKWVFMSFIATGIVIYNESIFSQNINTESIIIAIVSSIIAGFQIVCTKKLKHKLSSNQILFQGTSIGLFLVLLFYAFYDFNGILELFNLKLILFLGIIATGMANSLFYHALTKSKNDILIGNLIYLCAVFSSIFAVIFFDEKISLNIIIGGFLIILFSFKIKK